MSACVCVRLLADIFKESGAKVSGTWADNVLVSGSFADSWGNAYTGEFAATEAGGAGYVSGGSFNLVSGATAALA